MTFIRSVLRYANNWRRWADCLIYLVVIDAVGQHFFPQTLGDNIAVFIVQVVLWFVLGSLMADWNRRSRVEES